MILFEIPPVKLKTHESNPLLDDEGFDDVRVESYF